MVVVAVELPDGKRIGRVRMKVIENAKKSTLMPFVRENVEPGSEVITDGWKGYSSLPEEGFTHTVKVMKRDKNALPHVHLIISLLKRWLLGTYQGAVSDRYLDYYLDEYVFRFNRRTSKSRSKLFRRLMEQAVAMGPTTRVEVARESAEIRKSVARMASMDAEFRAIMQK